MSGNEYAVPDGAFSKLDKATGSFGAANYERAGRYVSRIDEVRFVDKRKGGTGIAIVKTILAVLRAPDPATMANGPAHTVGEQVTDFIDMGKDYGPDALCSFIACCFQPLMPALTAAAVTAEHGEKACSASQPCAGLILETDGVEQQNQNKTVTYVRISYKRVVGAIELANILPAEGVAILGGQDKLAALVQEAAAKAS